MVRFIGYCEPLMYEHIKDAVNYVKSKGGLLLHMTTNASMLDKGMSEFLVEAGLDSIIFSFQGGSKDEYIAMRNLSAPPMYEKVIENIKYLYSIKKDLRMKLTTTVTKRDSAAEIEDFIATHSAYVDEVQVSGFTHFVHVSDHFGKEKIWDEFGLDRPDLKGKVKCFLPNFEMLVKPNGDICACCGAYTEGLVYGNVYQESLMDIWRGGRAEQLRTKICGGDLEELENCRVCPVRYKYDNIDNAVHNTRK